jgi:hypothetical protein
MFSQGDVFDRSSLEEVVNFVNIKDFSDAMYNGIIAAYGMYLMRRESLHVPPLNFDNPDLKALATYITKGQPMTAYIKGCLFHYKQSCVRLAKRQNVVALSKTTDWFRLTELLLSTAVRAEYDQTVDEIYREFPLARSWLAWWTRESHASQIYKCISKMDWATWTEAPTTNNRIESMNRNMIRTSGTTHSSNSPPPP